MRLANLSSNTSILVDNGVVELADVTDLVFEFGLWLWCVFHRPNDITRHAECQEQFCLDWTGAEMDAGNGELRMASAGLAQRSMQENRNAHMEGSAMWASVLDCARLAGMVATKNRLGEHMVAK